MIKSSKLVALMMQSAMTMRWHLSIDNQARSLISKQRCTILLQSWAKILMQLSIIGVLMC